MELNVYNVNACLDLTLFVDKHTYIGEDWDPINGFNPTSFLCLSIIYLHRGGLGSHKWV